jgi:hypothetical protein
MSYELNKTLIIEVGKMARKRVLTQVGEMGTSLAVLNTHPHVDTGASVNAKQYTWTHPDKITPFKSLADVKSVRGTESPENESIYIIAPMEYDFRIERPFGIMARTKEQLEPFIKMLEGVNG